jgi:hypothetical protein
MHRSAAIEIIDPSGDAQEPRPRRRWARWLRLVLVLLALGGFGTLVAYVYYGMIRDSTTPDGQIPLVRADPAPFRARPDNPGGAEVPHQNLEVYDRLGQPTQSATPGGRQVERLLPPPEAPMPRPAAAPPSAPPATPTASAPPAPAAPAGPPAGQTPPVATQPATPAASQPATAAGAARDRMPAPGAPSQPQAATQQPAQASAPAIPAPPVASAPAAGGSVRVQVGALGTQEAAAREAERLRRSYGNVFGRVGITVVRGESGGSPIYRIQAGPVRDRAAADELCNALHQHHVGCIIVSR